MNQEHPLTTRSNAYSAAGRRNRARKRGRIYFQAGSLKKLVPFPHSLRLLVLIMKRYRRNDASNCSYDAADNTLHRPCGGSIRVGHG
jgi:hypothetical protein